MSDFNSKNKIVQANELVQKTNWEMNETALKLFKLCVSCIDVNEPPIDETITLTKKEIYDFLGFSASTNYTYVKQQMESLQKQVIKIETETSFFSITLMPCVEWKKENDNVKCTFSKQLMPYLIELNKHFLQYDIMNLKQIKSKYGLIIYEYLLSKHREVNKNSNYQYTYRMSVNKLRWITGTKDKYKRLQHLEEKVIKSAIRDINHANLEFLIDYEKIKIGRSVEHIDFKIRKRTSCLENEYDQIANKKYLKQKI